MPSLFRRLFGSVFIRLAAVMLLALIAINGIFLVQYYNVRFGLETALNRNLLHYARLLAEDVGSPPDRARAEALSRRLDMRIVLDGPESWTVGTPPRPFPGKHLRERFSDGRVSVMSIHGFYRLRVRLDAASSLTFDLYPSAAERSALRRYGLVTMLGACLVMAALYLTLRRILRPIRRLTKAAASIRDGELKRRVPEQGSRELRVLAETFNQMTARLESMIEGQRELLLGVSHELRTPLTRLRLRVEMLDPATDTTAIREDLRKMEVMITSLLNAARLRHNRANLRLGRVELPALLRELAARYGERPPGVVLTLPDAASPDQSTAPSAETALAGAGPIAPEPSDPFVLMADREQLAVLLGNLLDNAIKYSRPEGEPVELRLERRAGAVLAVVRDHGVGIPAEAIPRLFEPFFRADASRTRGDRDQGGFGLGLHLCQAIAQAHGAEILVDSQPGAGATMTVRFPSPAQGERENAFGGQGE